MFSAIIFAFVCQVNAPGPQQPTPDLPSSRIFLLEGKVTDPDGKPVPNCPVYLRRSVIREFQNYTVSSYQTNAEGKYRIFERFDEPFTGMLFASRDFTKEYGGSSSFGSNYADSRELSTIKLKRVVPLKFRVTDDAGKPIANAKIGQFMSWLELEKVIPKKYHASLLKTTDHDGQAEVATVDSDSSSLVVELPDGSKEFLQFKRSTDNPRVDLALTKKKLITLKVTGAPIEKLKRSTFSIQSSCPRGRIELSSIPITSNSIKVPVIENATTFYIRTNYIAPNDEYGCYDRTFHVETDQQRKAREMFSIDQPGPEWPIPETIELAFQPTRLIESSILDFDNDKGVPGVKFAFFGSRYNVETITTDQQGRWQARLLPGRHRVQIWNEIVMLTNSEGFVVSPDANQVPPLQAHGFCDLKGKLVDEQGRPIVGIISADLQKRVGNRGFPMRQTVITDAQGNFVLRHIFRHAEVKLTAATLDKSKATAKPVVTQSGGDEVINVVASGKGYFQPSIQVVDQTGRPIPQAQAIAHLDHQKYLSEFRKLGPFSADANGMVKFDNLLAKEMYRFEINAPGFVSDSTDVLDPAKELSPKIVLKLSPVGMIAGKVIDQNGKPVSEAEIFVYAGKRVAKDLKSSVDGTFQAPEAHANQGVVIASKKGYRTSGAVWRDGKQLTITLAEESSPPQVTKYPALSTAVDPNNVERGRALVRSQMEKIYGNPKSTSRGWWVQTHAYYDPETVIKFIVDPKVLDDETLDYFRHHAALSLARTDLEEGLALALDARKVNVETLIDIIRYAPRENIAKQQEILAKALLAARQESKPAKRARWLAEIGQQLWRLGDKELGEAVLREAQQIANQLPSEGADAYSKGVVATSLAVIDVDAAMKMLEGFMDKETKTRLLGELAYSIADVNPEKAEAPAHESFIRGKICSKICFRMAPVDLPRAFRLANDGYDMASRSRAYAVIASAIEKTNPRRAREMLIHSLTTVEVPGAYVSSRTDCTSAIANLPIVRQVAPELFDEYLWRAVKVLLTQALEDRNREAILPASIMLGMYDKDLGRALFEPRLKQREASFWHHIDSDDMRIVALGLKELKPEEFASFIDRTAKLPGSDAESSTANSVRHTICGYLCRSPQKRFDSLVDRLSHWVIGDED